MNWQTLDTEIVIVGALCAMACAIPGCFLLLRHMSMMGDAISHAVLPGLAIAFLITGSRSSITMFIGAAVVGVLTAVFTQWISRFGQVDRGAAMGVVFTTLFAIGLLIIVHAADAVDLDPGCVLYGAIEYTPLDRVILPLGIDIPRAALTLAVVLLINLALVLTLFKELRLSAFDPELATSLGINATLMHYLLMTLVAVTTVAAFEAVGSIIVIAMLIVPPATAFLLTTRLTVMVALSTLLAALAALLGHTLALIIPPAINASGTNTAGMMALAAGLLFLAAWLLAPQQGIITTRLRRKPIPDDQTQATSS
ncbi:metal ABC transporter permease [Mucisphaera calidilacus]|uniref:Manganese transport system membrane protein MntB n=1 Tax=Mucisphaera calidilacus TaxID=2527982 RepID=A0A518C023_9BACT|nr:metal ABC transporter permease [Mucisphaera calidilacus]QDU72559.1 Manganese transport system membrane protein MntB [Mucisphaera calidilacus]